MILTDGTNTFTTEYEDIKEEIISNASSNITLGGKPKSQADSQRLSITSTLRLSESEWVSLNTILTNYSASLTYTPTRKLATKSSIAAIGVVAVGAPKIKERVYNGEIKYHVTLELEEDPFA